MTGKRPLKGMFDGVPSRYDLVNRVFTLGFDERWRSRAARTILEGGSGRFLEAGCGTGDLILRLVGQVDKGSQIVGLDFSEPMLEEAGRKIAGAGLIGRVGLVCGDVSNMGFPEGCFDAVALAFSFRNMVWRNPVRERCLAEISRVLKPGGMIVIVESSQPDSVFLRFWYHAYLKNLVPHIGGLLSGQSGAYRYLAESARLFLGPEEVSNLLREAGFKEVYFESLLGGVAALHVARK